MSLRQECQEPGYPDQGRTQKYTGFVPVSRHIVPPKRHPTHRDSTGVGSACSSFYGRPRHGFTLWINWITRVYNGGLFRREKHAGTGKRIFKISAPGAAATHPWLFSAPQVPCLLPPRLSSSSSCSYSVVQKYEITLCGVVGIIHDWNVHLTGWSPV